MIGAIITALSVLAAAGPIIVGNMSGGVASSPFTMTNALGSCVPDSGGHGLLVDYYGMIGCVRVTDADPDDLRIIAQSAYPASATNTSGGDLVLSGGLGRRRIAMTQANCTAASDTITITISGTATVGTAGTAFACGASDAALATNVATWLDGLTGVDACANTACSGFTGTSGTVYVTRASDESAGPLAITLATNDATFAAITSGDDGSIRSMSMVRLGRDSFAKTYTAGDVSLDNGTSDTPGLKFYQAANDNFALDVAGSALRIVSDMDETGGAVRASFSESTFTVNLAQQNNSTFISTFTGALGWTIQSAANQACNTTCTAACVFGWNTAAGEVAVACTDATADKCLCAGSS